MFRRFRYYAEHIFTGTHIDSLDPEYPHPGAIAIRDGFVAAVDSAEDIMVTKGKKTQVTELGDLELRPGKILTDCRLSDEILEGFEISSDNVELDYEVVSERLKTRLEELAAQGYTSIFNNAEDPAKEIICRELVTDLHNAGKLPLRYFGSYRLSSPMRAKVVTDLLDTQCKSCITLGGRVNFDTLCIDVQDDPQKSGYMSSEYLIGLMQAAAAKGYSERIYTASRKTTLSLLETMGDLAASYPKYAFVLICPEEISSKEREDAHAEGVIILPQEQATAGDERIIGKGSFLGKLMPGRMGDFTIWNDGVCLETYISGKKVRG
ncbi:MAG: hypothetical protein IJM61_04875 [Firmicutes bacterium]|nr:hypothetical protein [Bacillota bacterium]